MPSRTLEAPTVRADLLRRLRCAQGHLRGITTMVERGAECGSVVRQVAAVQAALREVNRLMLTQHLDTCLRQLLEDADGDSAREKCLDEIVALYQLLGASAPLKRKERI